VAGCGRGSKLKTLVKSPDSVEAPCRHFRECGGCSHQELSYAQQLAQKQRRVRNPTLTCSGWEGRGGGYYLGRMSQPHSYRRGKLKGGGVIMRKVFASSNWQVSSGIQNQYHNGMHEVRKFELIDCSAGQKGALDGIGGSKKIAHILWGACCNVGVCEFIVRRNCFGDKKGKGSSDHVCL